MASRRLATQFVSPMRLSTAPSAPAVTASTPTPFYEASCAPWGFALWRQRQRECWTLGSGR